MAIVQNPLIGRTRKQAGGMIFSKMYDKNVIRAMPISVANPKTPAQMRHREFFGELGTYAKSLSDDLLIELYPNKPATRSRFSEFQKQIAVGRDVSGEVGTIDWDKVNRIGNGDQFIQGELVQTSDERDITIDWSDMVFSSEIDDADPIFLLFVNHKKKIVFLVDPVKKVDDGSYTYPHDAIMEDTDPFSIFIYVRPEAKFKPGADLAGGVK